MPDPLAPSRQDLEHLDLLSTFHYVVAGICALCGLFPILHFGMGLMFVLAPEAFFADAPQTAPFRLIGLMFVLFPGAMMVGAFVMAWFLFKAARKLKERTGYRFCQVVAAVACAFFPFGTVLGVFTLVVLNRGSVRVLFGEDDLAGPGPAASS
jgi:hypothetical protein